MYPFREFTSFAKWSKKLPPIYDDYTKSYTFLFEDTYDTNRPIYEADFNIVVLVERSEGTHQFRLSLCLKLEIKVGGNWQSFSCVRTYSLTIAVWKFYYILDLLEDNCQPMDLKEGFNIIWDIVKDGFKISTTTVFTRHVYPPVGYTLQQFRMPNFDLYPGI
ncbi:hypothetical protein F8M41_021080 [Gigaspora margarita]|uniref:Uncharacterized protein n=1 Tax=Gigaspora margarita TaxID=4874 RepID=A0A8H4EJB0_GIGMA|nr:hypothetical protein F8M41_021080 [Gigaspora margarita]